MKITASRLSTLLAIGENMNIEFKKASDGPKADTFESVCAFLNKTGGDLLLGVDDDGTVVGLPPKAIDAMIRNFVKVMNDPNLFEPTTQLYPEHIVYKRKHPEPVFDEDDVFRLIVSLNDEYSADRAFERELPQTKTSQESVVKGGVKSVVKDVVKNVVKKSDQIIACLKENPSATRQQLAAATGLTVRGVERNLMVLKQRGRLRRVGPDKGGHWEVIG